MGVCERPTGPFLDALAREFHFEPPRKAGKDTVDTIGAMHDDTIHVFVGLGGNFLSATPDTACTADAIRRCALTAQIATTLGRGRIAASFASVRASSPSARARSPSVRAGASMPKHAR